MNIIEAVAKMRDGKQIRLPHWKESWFAGSGPVLAVNPGVGKVMLYYQSGGLWMHWRASLDELERTDWELVE